ncbi:MAG: hypothetical protein NTW93_07945 [Phycisphaerae bacterium]|nr:hypothetical protein [Phycisphaerae bacterium]
MRTRIRYVLLIVAFFATAMILSGCRQKYQTQETVENGMVSCLNVTVTGPADDLSVTLLSPFGDSLKQNIEKIVMENMNNSATVCFAFAELGKGYPCSSDNRGKKGLYKLLIQRSESKKVVFKKTIEFIGGYEDVEIVKPE